MPPKVPIRRNRNRLTIAILLLVLGGIAFYKGSNDLAIRSLGLIACVASVYVIRRSKSQTPSVSDGLAEQSRDPKAADRPGRLMWTLGAVSLLLIGISYFFLRMDAAEGHHQIWPVYLFFWVVVVCGLFLSYLAGRMM